MKELMCYIFGHSLEVRFYSENYQWGKPWGEPRIEYSCSCGFSEEIKVPYITTGRAETEKWGVPISDIRGKLKENLCEWERGRYECDFNLYSIANKLKSRGRIIYFADNSNILKSRKAN